MGSISQWWWAAAIAVIVQHYRQCGPGPHLLLLFQVHAALQSWYGASQSKSSCSSSVARSSNSDGGGRVDGDSDGRGGGDSEVPLTAMKIGVFVLIRGKKTWACSKILGK